MARRAGDSIGTAAPRILPGRRKTVQCSAREADADSDGRVPESTPAIAVATRFAKNRRPHACLVRSNPARGFSTAFFTPQLGQFRRLDRGVELSGLSTRPLPAAMLGSRAVEEMNPGNPQMPAPPGGDGHQPLTRRRVTASRPLRLQGSAMNRPSCLLVLSHVLGQAPQDSHGFRVKNVSDILGICQILTERGSRSTKAIDTAFTN
jgi:hypothetical protein